MGVAGLVEFSPSLYEDKTHHQEAIETQYSLAVEKYVSRRLILKYVAPPYHLLYDGIRSLGGWLLITLYCSPISMIDLLPTTADELPI